MKRAAALAATYSLEAVLFACIWVIFAAVVPGSRVSGWEIAVWSMSTTVFLAAAIWYRAAAIRARRQVARLERDNQGQADMILEQSAALVDQLMISHLGRRL